MPAKKHRPKSKKRPVRTKKIKKKRASPASTKPAFFPIVGIGASAGGLEAFTKLLEHVPKKTGMAFVLIQHLSPGHESILAQLLERTIHLPISEVKDGVAVEPDHVYVIPPNTDMTIEEGVLRLEPRSDVRGAHLPIDNFFSSLAADRGNAAIGIVLSGSASDGVNGLKEIKTAGGITFAQDEESAAYTGMPRSAAASGCVDFILPPAAIAAELIKIGTHAYLSPNEAVADELLPTEGGPFHQILALLHRHGGTDFTHYKHTTVKRRIVRRMVLNKVEDSDHYLRFLRKTPHEIDALCEDLTIHVTRFFRDPDVFEALHKTVFPAIVKDRDPEQPIRMWIAGCSTGEEAYSMAIALLEFLSDRNIAAPIQIFASDVSDMAIEKARAGIYAADIEANVSPDRLRRFFTKCDGGWRISKAVREMCVFAKQDMTKDPPFSRMDLISCRNVLIFMGPVLQKKILPMFHYALKAGAHLLLGTAETIGGFKDLFSAVDQKNKIFAKRAVPSRLPHYAVTAHAPIEAKAVSVEDLHEARAEASFQREADRIILSRFGPPGVVVDDQMQIIQFRGHTGPYLEPVPGDASLGLLKMVRADLLPDLRMALKKAKKDGAAARRDGLQIKDGDKITELDIEVIPMKIPNVPGACFLILFEERAQAITVARRKGATKASLKKMEGAKKGSIDQLQHELETSRAYLQSIIEEKEITTEELRSANEEIQSTNEELQSTNEELETSKEELQSTNEELVTVNEELQNRNEELAVTLDDLNNLFVSSNIPIIIVGRDLKIRRFTPMAESVLNLIDTDVGRRIGELKPNIDVGDLEKMIAEVMETLAVTEHDVQNAAGHWYSLRLRPYRTADHRIDGVVLSLIDINEMKQAQTRIEAAQHYAESIVQTVREPLIVLDETFKVISANQAFYSTFKTDVQETEARIIFDLGNRQWDNPVLRHALEEILSRQRILNDYEFEHVFPAIGKRTMLLNARRIVMQGEQETQQLILLAIEDVTDRKNAEFQLQEYSTRLEEIVEERTRELVGAREKLARSEKLAIAGTLAGGIAHDIRNPLESISSTLYLLNQRYPSEDSAIVELRNHIGEAVERSEKIIANLLNLARGEKGNPKPIASDELASSCLRLNPPPEGIEIIRQLNPDIPPVMIDHELMEIALSNIILNAYQSMSTRGGRLTISNGIRDDIVYLAVSDTGCGIPPENIGRLFEPLFTTKGKGIGLGLAVVKKIIEANEGTIDIESEEGKGTTLTIHLPKAERSG